MAAGRWAAEERGMVWGRELVGFGYRGPRRWGSVEGWGATVGERRGSGFGYGSGLWLGSGGEWRQWGGLGLLSTKLSILP